MPVKVGLKKIEVWGSDLEGEVCRYEQEQVEKGQIVFYGPSNFTRWKREKWGNTPLREALPGKSGKLCCINRGFGSSCAEQQLYYYSRLVRPLAPKVLVYFPGFGNGFTFGYTAEEQFELAVRVMVWAKTDFPDLRIYLCGLSNHGLGSDSAKRFNALLCGYAETTPDCKFINLAARKELDDPAIYVEDNVHFNHEGYIRYAALFREVLRDELAEF